MNKFLGITVSAVFFFLFFSGIAVLDNGEKKSEFLLVQYPAKLVVFNKFQQTLSPEELGKFGSFAPFRILNKSELLGDNFTRCLKVEFNSGTFFILLENDATISGLNLAGIIKKASGFQLNVDTVQIISNGLFFATAGGEQLNLAKNTKLVVIFESDGKYYCRNPLGDTYGFIELKESDKGTKWIQIKIKGKEISGKPANPKEIVNLSVIKINDLIQKYFDYFNRQTNKSIAPPKLVIRNSQQLIEVAFVNEPDRTKYQEILVESLRDIKNSLTGSEKKAEIVDNKIIIKLQ